MEFHVINKLEVVAGVVVHTPIGYVTTDADAQTVCDNHTCNYLDWITDNLTELENDTILITDYTDFPVHEIAWKTNSIGDIVIPLITDLINLT